MALIADVYQYAVSSEVVFHFESHPRKSVRNELAQLTDVDLHDLTPGNHQPTYGGST